MSSGPFTNSKYENIAGNMIFPCRVQPETLELEIDSVANDPPAGAVTPGAPRIKLRKGRREFGPTIRYVTIQMTANGTGATAYLQTGNVYRIPILSNAVFSAISAEQTGTYQSVACKVLTKSPE